MCYFIKRILGGLFPVRWILFLWRAMSSRLSITTCSQNCRNWSSLWIKSQAQHINRLDILRFCFLSRKMMWNFHLMDSTWLLRANFIYFLHLTASDTHPHGFAFSLGKMDNNTKLTRRATRVWVLQRSKTLLMLRVFLGGRSNFSSFP